MCMILRFLTALPAPLVKTLRALHVLTAIVFLNWNLTVRTVLSICRESPIHKMFSLVLFAWLSLMPRVSVALETECAAAWLALNPLRWFGVLDFDNSVHAVRVGTELPVAWLHNLCIPFELLVFLESLLSQYHFDCLAGYLMPAICLWAFQHVGFPSLCYQISVIAIKTLFAKFVTAFETPNLFSLSGKLADRADSL
jgi:hypothetical protein